MRSSSPLVASRGVASSFVASRQRRASSRARARARARARTLSRHGSAHRGAAGWSRSVGVAWLVVVGVASRGVRRVA
ncbi:hypothetical protein ACXZ9C_11815 [Streptococcus agalactiae]